MPEVQREPFSQKEPPRPRISYPHTRADARFNHPDIRIAKTAAPSERLDRQAYAILYVAFVAAPLLAGVDKFTHLLANWDQYLAPLVPRVLGISAHSFMSIAGVIEVIAAIGVLLKPKIFAYVLSAWLAAVIVNLLFAGKYYDIALRDLGLCLAAFAFGRLATQFSETKVTSF